MYLFLLSVIGSPVKFSWIRGHTCEVCECVLLPLFSRRAPLRQPFAVLVRATQGSFRGLAGIQLSHFTSHMLEIHCLTCLRRLSSGCSRPQPNTHARQSTTGQCSRCQFCSLTILATRNHWLSLAFRSFSQHYRSCYLIDANTSNTSLPSSFLLADPCWVNEYPNGRPNISLEQHFTRPRVSRFSSAP